MVIDEVQRVPELLLAIKEDVDTDPRPGRFLLTGSARLLAMRGVPDALPGRMETIELWLLSQGEIDGNPDGFIDAVFKAGPEIRHTSTEDRASYVQRVVQGGFAEGIARPPRRRERFFDSYLSDLINRDVIQLSEIERGPEMRALVGLLAARSSQLVIPGALGNELDLSRQTEVFLIKRIPAWSRNLSFRAVAAPKIAFVDSGIAATLLDLDVARQPTPTGHASRTSTRGVRHDGNRPPTDLVRGTSRALPLSNQGQGGGGHRPGEPSWRGRGDGDKGVSNSER